MDNNFTRKISAKDPVTTTLIKGLAAGSVSLVLALLSGQHFPKLGIALLAMLLGSLSYGGSIVLFIRAMRRLGAARVSALFNTAPFVGMLLSFAIFRSVPVWTFYAALPIMILGTVMIVYEKHNHSHTHETLTHDHAHSHDDEHHNHVHDEPIDGSHSHEHTHESLSHEHEHRPDLHHRHEHEK
jgi:uncharacterized membrane protein